VRGDAERLRHPREAVAPRGAALPDHRGRHRRGRLALADVVEADVERGGEGIRGARGAVARDEGAAVVGGAILQERGGAELDAGARVARVRDESGERPGGGPDRLPLVAIDEGVRGW